MLVSTSLEANNSVRLGLTVVFCSFGRLREMSEVLPLDNRDFSLPSVFFFRPNNLLKADLMVDFFRWGLAALLLLLPACSELCVSWREWVADDSLIVDLCADADF
jgi:hypothetical protein